MTGRGGRAGQALLAQLLDAGYTAESAAAAVNAGTHPGGWDWSLLRHVTGRDVRLRPPTAPPRQETDGDPAT